ncbi:MAG: beta-ketoacyl-ACP synthase III [Pseudanabaenaceae cyanobacterium]
MSSYGVRLVSSGSALPERVITNAELAQWVDTSDEWITTRTGINQRHIIGAQDSTTSLAVQAGQQALAKAGLAPTDLDLILVATSTTDDLFGTAPKVQRDLGAQQAVGFDLSAACSGFVFGLVTASQFIRTGLYRHILLIGADTLSRWVDWDDRRTCILFGDGAGAVLLTATSPQQDALLSCELRSDGTGNHLLNLLYNPEKHTFDPVFMNGKEVYRFAVTVVPEVVEKAIHKANLTTADIDWLVLHQANQRIIDAVVERLGLPPHKAVSNMGRCANTSAASIPIAIDEWINKGAIQEGHILALAGFGAGLSWGAVVVRWG